MCKLSENASGKDDAAALVKEAKHNLLQILSNHSNESTDPKVAEAVEDLSKKWNDLLASSSPGDNSPAGATREDEDNLLDMTELAGKWIQISAPNFPNVIKDPDAPDKKKYTLGRLSFNMFQPKNLVCTLEGITNTVAICKEEKDDSSDDVSSTYTYDVLQDLTVHTDKGDVPATLLVKGKCYPDVTKKNRVTAVFTAGELRRGKEVNQDPQMRQIWEDTFHEAYTNAEKERGYVSAFGMWLMKLAFKLTLPTDESDSESCARYEMKRAPKGYLDILYVDEDLRITRGNRGTVIIVQRAKE